MSNNIKTAKQKQATNQHIVKSAKGKTTVTLVSADHRRRVSFQKEYVIKPQQLDKSIRQLGKTMNKRKGDLREAMSSSEIGHIVLQKQPNHSHYISYQKQKIEEVKKQIALKKQGAHNDFSEPMQRLQSANIIGRDGKLKEMYRPK